MKNTLLTTAKQKIADVLDFLSYLLGFLCFSTAVMGFVGFCILVNHYTAKSFGTIAGILATLVFIKMGMIVAKYLENKLS